MDRWNALAGYRGLRDPQVWRHFNGTFLGFEAEGWGPNQELMTNLDLRYDVAYLGADSAADAIRARLDAGLPAFFYLWSPHPLNARYSLNRIQLPAYTLFELGLLNHQQLAVSKALGPAAASAAASTSRVMA